MGYDKYVKESLESSAEVFYPEENCRFAEYILRYAHEWKKNGKWGDDVDLVHWNAGLWDALELFGDEPLTSLSYYGEAIARIDRRLRMLFPNAKLVFATSTCVKEVIGGRVLSVICPLLDISPDEINIENFNPENYSKDNIGY